MVTEVRYGELPSSCSVHFNFQQPEEWARWLQRFERFRQASNLDKKSDKKQVNPLIYAMGDEADDILKSFHLSEGDAKKYKTVKEKFDEYFISRRKGFSRGLSLTNADKSHKSLWTALLQHYTAWQNTVPTRNYMRK